MTQFIPALQRTQNLFDLYQYICGKSEVPAVFNFWSSVAMLAATLENRVWYEKHKGEKLYPHLYVMLVGAGGLGKGTAISQAVRIAKSSINIQTYRGKLTCAHLIDVLGKAEKDEFDRKVVKNPRLWLLMDELKNDVGSHKQLAEEFVAMMTELYTATNYTINTGTRTSGEIDIVDPLVNWMAGTTEAWLRMVLTKDLVDSGFTARTCFIFGKYDFNKRYPRIVYPPDYDEVMEHIQLRLWMIQQFEGRILMTEQAESIVDQWYMMRPAPTEEAWYSMWHRHHDMMLKFAMINCLADPGPPVINASHMLKAKAMVRQIVRFTSRLLEVAHETYATKPSNEIASYLEVKGSDWSGHSDMLRYFRSKRGMDSKQVKDAVFQLIAEGSVEVERTATGKTSYRWREVVA
jgi:hypothetical protein